jgi:hypothetical protein
VNLQEAIARYKGKRIYPQGVVANEKGAIGG